MRSRGRFTGVIRRGLQSGLSTTWKLGRVIFPITLLLTVAQETVLMEWVAGLFSPVLGLLGLPGEAALVLASGYLLNLYAAIGAILSLELTVKEVFTLALMLSFAHTLPVETAVCRAVGVPVWYTLSVRLGLSFLSAAVMRVAWQGGEQLARTVWLPPIAELAGPGEILLVALQTAAAGVLQLAVIVFPLMLIIQVLKETGFLERLTRSMRWLTRPLGLTPAAGLPLMAGIFFGLAFGAGVILDSAREGNVTRKDLYLLVLFLSGSHAVVEDTLIFLPTGISVWPLLVLRLLTALLLTMLAARLWEWRDRHRSVKGVRA